MKEEFDFMEEYNRKQLKKQVLIIIAIAIVGIILGCMVTGEEREQQEVCKLYSELMRDGSMTDYFNEYDKCMVEIEK